MHLVLFAISLLSSTMVASTAGMPFVRAYAEHTHKQVAINEFTLSIDQPLEPCCTGSISGGTDNCCNCVHAYPSVVLTAERSLVATRSSDMTIALIATTLRSTAFPPPVRPPQA